MKNSQILDIFKIKVQQYLRRDWIQDMREESVNVIRMFNKYFFSPLFRAHFLCDQVFFLFWPMNGSPFWAEHLTVCGPQNRQRSTVFEMVTPSLNEKVSQLTHDEHVAWDREREKKKRGRGREGEKGERKRERERTLCCLKALKFGVWFLHQNSLVILIDKQFP